MKTSNRFVDNRIIKTELVISQNGNKYRIDHRMLMYYPAPYINVHLVAGDREIYIGSADAVFKVSWLIYHPETDTSDGLEFAGNVMSIEDGIKWLMQRCDAVLDAYYQKLYEVSES